MSSITNGSCGTIIEIDPAGIRLDGKTQSRLVLNRQVVEEYAGLMREGVKFPPVCVWLEGSTYWLSDGFHRVAAARLAGCTRIAAQCRKGNLADARWASFAANSAHGRRRTREDVESIMRRTLEHPYAGHLSNVQVARHLGVAEATVRRHRKSLTSSGDEDGVRTAIRQGHEYEITISKIGRKVRPAAEAKSCRVLKSEFGAVRSTASADARVFIEIIEAWIFGNASLKEAVREFERFIADLRSRSEPLNSNTSL